MASQISKCRAKLPAEAALSVARSERVREGEGMRGGEVNTSTFTIKSTLRCHGCDCHNFTHTHTYQRAGPLAWRTRQTRRTTLQIPLSVGNRRLLDYYTVPLIANNATAPVTVTRTSKLSGVSVPNLRGFSEWDCIENKHGERRECECSDGSLKDSEPGGAERKEEVRRLVEFCDETNLMVYLESESAFYLMHTCTRCFATYVATWLVLFS